MFGLVVFGGVFEFVVWVDVWGVGDGCGKGLMMYRLGYVLFFD